MCAEQYEFTNKDLNPRFLFTEENRRGGKISRSRFY